MLVYNITNQETANYKLEQLKSIGLTSGEFENLTDILSSSYSSVTERDHEENLQIRKLMKFSNFDELYGHHQFVP